MDRAHRTVVSGIHRLQHVQGFAAAHLADDQTVRAHSDGVPDQLAEGHHFLARWNALQATDVPLRQPEFGGFLDGDDPLVIRDAGRQGIEQGGLSAAGAARDQQVGASLDGRPEKAGGLH